VEASLAAQILIDALGLRPGPILEQLAKEPGPKYRSKATVSASLTLEAFLAGLNWLNAEELVSFFQVMRNLSTLLEKDGITKKCRRDLKRSSRPTQRKTQVTLSKQHWPKQASYLSPMFFGKMRFSRATCAPGCTE
jgi:hypothetical protein